MEFGHSKNPQLCPLPISVPASQMNSAEELVRKIVSSAMISSDDCRVYFKSYSYLLAICGENGMSIHFDKFVHSCCSMCFKELMNV